MSDSEKQVPADSSYIEFVGVNRSEIQVRLEGQHLHLAIPIKSTEKLWSIIQMDLGFTVAMATAGLLYQIEVDDPNQPLFAGPYHVFAHLLSGVKDGETWSCILRNLEFTDIAEILFLEKSLGRQNLRAQIYPHIPRAQREMFEEYLFRPRELAEDYQAIGAIERCLKKVGELYNAGEICWELPKFSIPLPDLDE